jgi:hypothetical protein
VVNLVKFHSRIVNLQTPEIDVGGSTFGVDRPDLQLLVNQHGAEMTNDR